MVVKKYTSFDVYNTLIRRIFPVNMLYNLMEDRVWKLYHIKGFSRMRTEAEDNLKTKMCNYTLKDIYREGDFKELSSEIRQNLMQFEEKCEIWNTLVNETGYKLYMKYSEYTKCICISDMYLSSDVIKTILKKHGYTNIEKIYVSCEFNCSKRQGLLYKKVIEDLQIEKINMLHIGDAKLSDFIVPKISGISSKLIINRDLHTEDYLYKIGFSVFGPLFYEFMVWIHHNIGDNQLIFVAREGDFLRECYKKVYKQEGNLLYISREAVIHGCIANLMKELPMYEALKYIKGQRNETCQSFLRRLGVNETLFLPYMEREGMSLNSPVCKDFFQFLNKYKKEIILEMQIYEQQFTQYILQVLSEKNIALVDIGWNGSMQDLLTQFFEVKHMDYNLCGFYLGCLNSNKKKGFLFNSKDKLYADILSFSGLLETITMPEYGTVKGYSLENGVIKPIFRQSEYTPQAYSKIKQIQQGILDKISSMCFWEGQPCFNHKEIQKELLHFGCLPTLKQLKHWSEFTFYENGNIYPLIDTPAIQDFFHPDKIYNKFLQCKWKAAWMRKTFKIPFPWYILLRVIRRNVDNKEIKELII